MSDIFHERASDEFLEALFRVISISSQHQFLVLTKRASKMKEFFKTREVPANAWLGVSVESDKFIHRADELREIKTKNRWINCEPLLGCVASLNLSGISWCRAGGESGARARECRSSWAYELALKCSTSGVPFYFAGFGDKAVMDKPLASPLPQMPPIFKSSCSLFEF